LLDSHHFYRRLLFCYTLWSVAVDSSCHTLIDSNKSQYGITRRRQGKILAITVFYLWLLFWDGIQGINWVINIRWIQRAEIITGNLCITQGTLLVQLIFPFNKNTHIFDYSIASTTCKHWSCSLDCGHVLLYSARLRHRAGWDVGFPDRHLWLRSDISRPGARHQSSKRTSSRRAQVLRDRRVSAPVPFY